MDAFKELFKFYNGSNLYIHNDVSFVNSVRNRMIMDSFDGEYRKVSRSLGLVLPKLEILLIVSDVYLRLWKIPRRKYRRGIFYVQENYSMKFFILKFLKEILNLIIFYSLKEYIHFCIMLANLKIFFLYYKIVMLMKYTSIFKNDKNVYNIIINYIK